jgi:hypothetical protein
VCAVVAFGKYYYKVMTTQLHKRKNSMVKKLILNERALLARVNRKLVQTYEMLRKYRGNNPPALYYHVDLYNNAMLGNVDDLEQFAREAGVLAAYEALAA